MVFSCGGVLKRWLWWGWSLLGWGGGPVCWSLGWGWPSLGWGPICWFLGWGSLGNNDGSRFDMDRQWHWNGSSVRYRWGLWGSVGFNWGLGGSISIVNLSCGDSIRVDFLSCGGSIRIISGGRGGLGGTVRINFYWCTIS